MNSWRLFCISEIELRIRTLLFPWSSGMSRDRSICLSSLRRRRTGSGSSSISNGCDSNVAENEKRGKSIREVVDDFGNLPSSVKPGPLQIADGYKRTNETLHIQSSATTTFGSGDASFPGLECLREDFYDVSCEQLARSLLGKILVRKLDSGHILKGRIVETECYLGGEDKASHSFRGKMTERNAPMFMKPGTAYVYFTYGMYHCFNISSQGPGAAVLIRAVEPIEGLDVMAAFRERGVKKSGREDSAETAATDKKRKKKKPLKAHELCSGPAKLCIAFDIDRDSCNKRDLSTWPGLSLHRDVIGGVTRHHQDVDGVIGSVKEVVENAEEDVGDAETDVVVVTKRVGIESAGCEWAAKALRFYLLGNLSVSRRDRAKEKELVARLAAASPY